MTLQTLTDCGVSVKAWVSHKTHGKDIEKAHSGTNRAGRLEIKWNQAEGPSQFAARGLYLVSRRDRP